MNFEPWSEFSEQLSCALCLQLMDLCEEVRMPASRCISTAEKGCSICKLIRAAVETFVVDPNQRDSCLVGLEGGLCLYVGPSLTRMLIDVYCLPLAICPQDWEEDVVRMDQLPGSTASLDSWGQAKRWLEICEKEHENCRPRAEALPTRLLDLKVDFSHIKLLDVAESKVAESMCRVWHSVIPPLRD